MLFYDHANKYIDQLALCNNISIDEEIQAETGAAQQ